MTDQTGKVKFEVDKTYPSAVRGRRFRVSSIHQVKDSVCMVVFVDSLNVLFGRTNLYYLAVVDEDDESRATVLLDEGFTTIYAESE